MDELVITPLDALEASLGTLLTTLTTTPTFSTAPAASTALLAADDALTSSLTALKEHQQNYARILHLRAEATRLEDQIKSIIRTCGELRNEIGAIHPSILEDSSEDEDGEGQQEDVDYKTLLSFARRIGKYNARAAREAEEDSIRRRQDAKERATAPSRPAANGNVPPVTTETTSGMGNIIPDNERTWLNETAVAARAAQGMAFPAAERLRLGMLGQLQYAREQGGEESVEREIERLMGGSLDEETAPQATIEPEAISIHATEMRRQAQAQAQAQAPTNASTSNARPQRPPERKRSVAPLNLDLWNEDEDDD
jgi:Vitamin-D-receptor interacting Mediator subunit 4